MNKNAVYIVSGNAITEFLAIDTINGFMYGANCQCTMRCGIAREVVQRLPELYEADQETRNHYAHPEDKLGHLSYATFPNSKYGYNLYTQLYYGTDRIHLNYGAFAHSLQLAHTHLTQQLGNQEVINVAIPRIGCGLDGGDWAIGEEILTYADTPRFHYYVFDLG